MSSLQNYKLLCGVPYTALPIATIISTSAGIPMVMRRKEAKDYGTRKMIEGNYEKGDTCLIIEDVVTSGSSILETVKDLTEAGLSVTEAIVVLDRQQGGLDILKKKGVNTISLLNMSQLLKYLREEKCIDESQEKKVLSYLNDNQIDATILAKNKLGKV